MSREGPWTPSRWLTPRGLEELLFAVPPIVVPFGFSRRPATVALGGYVRLALLRTDSPNWEVNRVRLRRFRLPPDLFIRLLQQRALRVRVTTGLRGGRTYHVSRDERSRAFFGTKPRHRSDL